MTTPEKVKLRQKTLRVLAVPFAFNEDKKIGSVIDRLNGTNVTEIIVLDDGSTDKTAQIALAKGVKVLSHDKQLGIGAAITTAIEYARRQGFDVLVIMAGNDKDRPNEIPRLLKPIIEEDYDLVQGSRYLKGGGFGNMPLHRRIATQLIHPILFSLVTGRRITDSTNGFRAIKLSVFDDERINIHQPWLNRYELEPYIFYKVIKLGYKVKEVPVTKIYPPKELGYSKMKPITGWWSIIKPLIYLPLGLKK